MIPSRTNFVSGEIKMVSKRSATIVASMVISPMIVPNHPSSTRSKKMMAINTSTQRKTMKRKITRRRNLSRGRKKSKLFLESRSPMAKFQVIRSI